MGVNKQPPQSSTSNSLDYKAAGVDINAGNLFVERIKGYARATYRPGVMAGLGGFGALFELPLNNYKHPILVSGTDGVGTKLKLAQMLNKHDTIGIDLVAMCANDIAVTGAEPLFFLDYFATGRLQPEAASEIIKGISEGCQLAGAALIGGETAEMPGMYHGDDYDLAGFCVGIVEKDKIIDGQHITPGCALIGLASSGPHSNGYSLIRKVLELNHIRLDQGIGDTTLGAALLNPTRIYVKTILQLSITQQILGIAHITGGGIIENLPRILSENVAAELDRESWPTPPIFEWLQSKGNITEQEMLRTFNCGLGMIICVPQAALADTMVKLTELGEKSYHIGQIVPRQATQDAIIWR